MKKRRANRVFRKSVHVTILLFLLVFSNLIYMPIYAANYTVVICCPAPLAACLAGATITIDGTTYGFPDCTDISVLLSAGTHNIRANAPPGWVFEQWYDDVNTRVSDRYSPATTLTVSGNGIIAFSFKEQPASYTVTFKTNPTSSGVSITFSGTTYTNGQIGSYSSGDYLATANVPPGFQFVRWYWSGSSGNGVYVPNFAENPTTVQVRGDGWLKAVYAAKITFYTNPSDKGSIQYRDSTYTNSQYFFEVNLPPDYNNIVTIVANVPSGYTFSGWSTTGSLSVSSPSSSSTTLTVNGPGTLTANFQAAGYTVTAQITGLPSGITTAIYIDGVSQGQYGSGTFQFTVSEGSHTFSVDQYAPPNPSGTRYHCPSNSQTVSSAATITFAHHTEYYLTVNTEPSGITSVFGGSWYDSGTNAQTGTAPSLVTSGGVTYTFSTWKVDGTPVSGNPITVTMNAPHTATAVYTAQNPDFSISVSPSYLSFTRPSSGSTSKISTITVTSVNGFSSQVSLSTSWVGKPPSGVSCSLSKNPVTPPANGQDSSTLTVTVSSSASIGSFTLRVTGINGSLAHSTDIAVAISSTPSLSVQVSANPGSITTSQQSTITVTVTSGGTPVSGASVTLSSTGGSLNPSSGTTNSNGQFSSTFSSSTTGTFTITAIAFKSGYTQGSGNTQVTVTSQPQPFDFRISVSPSSRTITAGQSTTYAVTVSLVSGSAQTVSLSLSGHHISMSYSFSPSSGSPTFASTLTVYTTSSTPPATYTLTITGTGGVTRQQQVTLLVQPKSTSPPQTPSLISPSNGATLTSTSVIFSWSSSLGATDYQIEINGPTNKLEIVYSTSYQTILQAGSYTWRVRAHNSTGWSSWTQTWSFTILVPKGTVIVYIYNVNGKLANYMSGKTVAYLAGAGGDFFATMNRQGYANFSDIPVGTYRLSVFHTPQEAGALNFEEYWGAESVQVSQGYNEVKFTRSAPWVIDYSVKVDGKEIARPGFMSQEVINIASFVDFQISVKNSGTLNTNTKVRLIIDADQTYPFDYDQTSSWKTTSPGSSSFHQFSVSFVASSQFSKISPEYSAYIVVYSIYDGKEYITDQYTWTKFVSFKVQFSSEQARIIMQLAHELLDILFKQNSAVIEEILRKIAEGVPVSGIPIEISPATINKLSGQTSLWSVRISVGFKCAEMALIISDNSMSYDEKVDKLAEVVARAIIASAMEIALTIATEYVSYKAALAVFVAPPISLGLSATSLFLYLGRGFISNWIADVIVSHNLFDIKEKTRSFLMGFGELLFQILNKNAVSFSGHCPINIYVSDSRGRRTGAITSGTTYSILEEIPGSKFFNESDHQAVWIAFPESGDYRVVVNGTDKGEYSIVVTSFVDGEVYRNETISGTIEKGETNILSVKLEGGVNPRIGPLIQSIFANTMVEIGEPLNVSLKVSGKDLLEASASLRDSNNVSQSSILVKQGAIYMASLDTSGMEKGVAILTLIVKDCEGLSTTANFIVMLLGRLQIKIQPYKSEIVSGEHLKLEILIMDQNDDPVDSVDVSLIFAGNKYIAQNTARGLYSTVLDTRRLEGSYTVYINASKPLYRSTAAFLSLIVRPWWWPYLPYVAIVASLLVISLLAWRRGKEVIVMHPEFLVEAKKLLEQREYAEAVKYSAEDLKSRLVSSLNLSKSLTVEELIHKVTELKRDVKPDKLEYVLKLGEKCGFGKYKPSKSEAEKALKIAEEIIRKL